MLPLLKGLRSVEFRNNFLFKKGPFSVNLLDSVQDSGTLRLFQLTTVLGFQKGTDSAALTL